MVQNRVDNYEQERGRRGANYGVSLSALIGLGIVVLLAIGFVAGIWYWFGWRIDVPAGKFMPLMTKTGKDIDNDMIFAPDSSFKGPQFTILTEGRHFRNPLKYDWPSKAIDQTIIPAQKVGILIRKYGKPLNEGQVIVGSEKEKGILADPVLPGRYPINTWAYDIEKVDMVKIEPGQMGLVTLRVGNDPVDPFQFVVKKGERGTQPFLLSPGTHPGYSNPYVYQVIPIDVRSQKFDFEITFPSMYGFVITVLGTIEWAPDLEKLPELFVKYADEDDPDLKSNGGINNIIRKVVIMPAARSYYRMIGGEYKAVSFMKGDTRTEVQEAVEAELKVFCAKEGIDIRSVVIRDAQPPQPIRDQYVRREIANREIDKFNEEIKMEIGSPVMVGGTAKLDSAGNPVLDEYGKPVMIGGTVKVDAEGNVVREGGRIAKIIEQQRKYRAEKLGVVRVAIAQNVRGAEQYQKVEVTRAEKDLQVAKIKLEAAKDRAEAIRAGGLAEAAVVLMAKKAEAEGIKANVLAFDNDGKKYAQYKLIQKFAPGIGNILSNTDGIFADLFNKYSTLGESGK